MPTAPDGLKGQESTVHELFGITDDRFRAPEFQRHYVWGTEGDDSQIRLFWDDFDRLIEEDGDEDDRGIRSSLFLGAIVLQVLDPGPPSVGVLYSVIDGQQRILTLYMILVAIAEASQELGDEDSARDMSTEYLLARTSQFARRPRVEPTVSDRGVMAGIMACLRTPEPKSGWSINTTGAPRLTSAWEAIRSGVRERCRGALGEGAIDADELQRLRDNILHRLEVVTITLGSRHDPHEVYERLNTRGRDLTEIDLVRNAVFYTAGGDPDAARRIYENHWDPFESQLGDRQDAYWFPYAMIRVPQTTRARSYRDLVKYWRDHVTSDRQGEEQARKIIEDLREFLGGFRAVTGIADNTDGQVAHEVWEAITRLKQMDAPPVMYPFLMQLVQHHLRGTVSGSEVIAGIDVVDSFLVRRLFCGFGTQGIHAVFKTLWGNVSDDLSRIADEIENRKLQFPDDDEFEQGIRTFALYRIRGARRRYVLSEYERSFTAGDPPEPLPADVTADHLLPQSAEPGQWGNFTQDEKERLVHTWANLVPMSAVGGASKGAKSWEDQRKLMVDDLGTVYKSTRDVFDRWPDQWDAGTIDERADRLVDWALARWPKT